MARLRTAPRMSFFAPDDDGRLSIASQRSAGRLICPRWIKPGPPHLFILRLENRQSMGAAVILSISAFAALRCARARSSGAFCAMIRRGEA